MYASAPSLAKIANRLACALALIVFAQHATAEAATVTAPLGVSAVVVSGCSVTTISKGLASGSGGGSEANATVNLKCSRGSNAIVDFSDSRIITGPTSTGEQGLVSYSITEVSSAEADANTLTINF